MLDAIDVLPGKKSEISAAVLALTQIALAFGLLSPEQAQAVNYGVASVLPIFLGLRRRREQKG